ncbi:MAG: DEAD/DEAH box helicase [Halioglobus sp.]|nr:DEAD/DEAH box helicase [Halioglobus sp.]
MNFNELGLSKAILRAVDDKGYTVPSPIQAKTIPVILEGVDLMASAQTGTGKTAAFVLPLLQHLDGGKPAQDRQVRVLIVTPTRELAAQIHASIVAYGKHLKLSSLAVFGGVNIGPQISKLRRGVDILVATPGRLLDLHGQKALRLDAVERLVLDEADRMLDMGFIHDIKRIQSYLPSEKQSLLFSATFSDDIRKLAKTMLRDPVEIDVAPRNTTVESVHQRIHPVDKGRKTALLIALIKDRQWRQVLVFSRTKHGANKLVKSLLKADIRAVAIHGNKSQAQRTRALADFKRGGVDVMVATDIAARGIDIVELPHVVNFDLPHVPEDYVHRIGRTGRAGSSGAAVSLVCAEESGQLRGIERLIGISLARETVAGFEPEQPLAVSRPATGKKSGGRRPPGAIPPGQGRHRKSARGGRRGARPAAAGR